jgi:hypothetical protein
VKCPVRISLSICPHVKKQALHRRKTQYTPVQVVFDQQRVVASLRNDTHTASTRGGRSTLADPLPMRVLVVEARYAVAPTTNFDAGGCSPDDSVTRPCTESTQTIVVSHGLIGVCFTLLDKTTILHVRA